MKNRRDGWFPGVTIANEADWWFDWWKMRDGVSCSHAQNSDKGWQVLKRVQFHLPAKPLVQSQPRPSAILMLLQLSCSLSSRRCRWAWRRRGRSRCPRLDGRSPVETQNTHGANVQQVNEHKHWQIQGHSYAKCDQVHANLAENS